MQRALPEVGEELLESSSLWLSREGGPVHGLDPPDEDGDDRYEHTEVASTACCPHVAGGGT